MPLVYAATAVDSDNIIDLINGLNGAGIADGTAFTTASTLNLGNAAQLQSVAPLSIVMRIKTSASPSGSIFLEKAGRFRVLFQSNSSKTLTFLMDGVGGDGIVTSPSSSFAFNTYFDLVLRWDGTNVDNQIFMDVNGVSTQGTVAGAADFSGADTGDFIINNSAGDVTFEYLYIYDEFLSYEEGEAIRADPDAVLPVADTTAPILSSPTATATSSTTASGSVTTDEANGTLYYYASINATETGPDIVTNGANKAVSETGVQNVTFSGLTANTDYYPHYVQDDAAGNRSNVVSGAQFTTPAPSLSIDSISDTTPQPGDTITIDHSSALDDLTSPDYTVTGNSPGQTQVLIPDPTTHILSGQTYATVNFNTAVSIPLTDGTNSDTADLDGILPPTGTSHAEITSIASGGFLENDPGATVGMFTYVFDVVGTPYYDAATGAYSLGDGESFKYKIYNGEWSTVAGTVAEGEATPSTGNQIILRDVLKPVLSNVLRDIFEG